MWGCTCSLSKVYQILYSFKRHFHCIPAQHLLPSFPPHRLSPGLPLVVPTGQPSPPPSCGSYPGRTPPRYAWLPDG